MADIHMRGIPSQVHRQLKSQAARAGQPLNEFLVARLVELSGQRLPSTPTVLELATKIREKGPYHGPSSAEVIRTERDGSPDEPYRVVTFGSGGPCPGIDITNNAAVRDAMDAE